MKAREDDPLAGRLGALADPQDDSNWGDVLRRSLKQPLANIGWFRGRRVLLIAAAVATLLLVLGVALAATLGGFSDWLSGKPGSPASPTEQSAFQQANARSWAAFPTGTKLRRLIVARAAGSTYRLFGFTSGDEICLRLTVDGEVRQALLSCFPRLQLANTSVPAIVGVVDAPAGNPRTVPEWRKSGHSQKRITIHSSLVSFGVIADGVSIVELRFGRQSGRALVAGDAFLLVRPNYPYATDSVVDKIFAGASRSQLEPVPFAHSYGNVNSPPSTSTSFGPTQIDVRPPRRSIGWVLRREPRGLSIRQAGVPAKSIWGHYYGIHFARVLRPDPNNHSRIVVAVVGRNVICVTPLDSVSFSSERSGSRGCASFLKSDNPVAVWEEVGSRDQLATISGLATDAVDHVDLFLSDGERWHVPLRDNAFVIAPPRILLPAKLVSYDTRGQIIGIDALADIETLRCILPKCPASPSVSKRSASNRSPRRSITRCCAPSSIPRQS